MTPQEREALARARFAALTGARASGVVLMLFGMWIWYGDLLDEGGNALVGSLTFALGFFQSLVLTRILTRRWRTPPRP